MPLRTAARKCPDATFLPSDPAAYDEASEEVMGLLRDFGHPVEVWGWDEAYVGADLKDRRPVPTGGTDPRRRRGRDGTVVFGRHQRQQAARQGRDRIRQARRDLRPHRGQLDGGDGRPRRRRAVGRRSQDGEKACGHGNHHRRRPGRPPTRNCSPRRSARPPGCGFCCWPRAAATPTSAPAVGCRARAAT